MAKSTIAKGKLVRKFGENIFGNPKYDRLLNRKPYNALVNMDKLEGLNYQIMGSNCERNRR